jgi:hypothetical protein
MGRLPPVFPAICELFKESRLEGGGLARNQRLPLCPITKSWQLTVNVGSTGPEVADSTREDPLAEASLATLETEELASLMTD